MINNSFSSRLHASIPGGAHTYSRGDDQFPQNAPEILIKGKGSFVWGPNDAKYLDYGMALRSVILGYANREVNSAAYAAMELGNGLTRASLVELEAAELLINSVPSVEMVKFTKNGSSATSAAVKLARAYTGNEIILRCAQHPFFSYDDWFIGSTEITKGVPVGSISLTKQFNFNDIDSLTRCFDELDGKVACVIMEPSSIRCPHLDEPNAFCCGEAVCSRKFQGQNFLKQVREICTKNSTIFILDETITGFRWDLAGAQNTFDVSPDLTTFGKAMANGFSVAAVGGKREIMELGSTQKIGAERVFLLSTTHGAEMSGLAAFQKTYEILRDKEVIPYIWQYGSVLIKELNNLIGNCGMEDILSFAGPAPNPNMICNNTDGTTWWEMRTLISQEMIKRGVLMPWISVSYSHDYDQMNQTLEAFKTTLEVVCAARDNGVKNYLLGPAIKPVFRQFN